MKPSTSAPATGTCSRCGECCRWIPLLMVRQCNPSQLHYLRERGQRESEGYFLTHDPCRHLKPSEDGSGQTSCDIYEKRPATCRDFSGKELSGGRRYFVPSGCTLAGKKNRDEEQAPADHSK
jgi:Putative zinc- or iron-chelating domain